MHNGSVAQLPAFEEAGVTQPTLDDVVYEVTTSERLMSYVAEAEPTPQLARHLDPEALDPAIFAGLMAP